MIDEGLQYLKNNSHVKNNGFEIETENDAVKLTKDQAILCAKKAIGEGLYNDKTKITLTKVKFSNHCFLPNKLDRLALVDVPTWIVTFHGIELIKHGEVVSADMNVVIDANTGDELLTFAHEELK